MKKQVRVSLVAALGLSFVISTATAQEDCKSLLKQVETLFKANKIQELAPLVLKSCPICEKDPGAESKEYAEALHNLGVLYGFMGKYRELLSNALRAESIYRKHDSISIHYSRILLSVGQGYLGLGQYEKASEPLTKSLELIVVAREDTLPTYANIINALAANYFYVGEFNKALSQFQKSKLFFESIGDTTNLVYLVVCGNLANLMFFQGNFDAAKNLFERTLGAMQRAGLSKHPNYGALLTNSTGVYVKLGLYEQAEKMLKEEINRVGETTELSYFHVMALSNFGLMLMMQGKHTEADTFFRKALPLAERLLGADSQDYNTILMNLAFVNARLHKFDESSKFLEKAESYFNQLPDLHQFKVYWRNNLAKIAKEKGDIKTARQIVIENVKWARKALGQTHTEFPTALLNAVMMLGSATDKDAKLIFDYASEFYALFQNQVRKNFMYLTEKEKYAFLEKSQFQAQVCNYTLFKSSFRNDRRFIENIFDQTLALKGILLSDIQKNNEAVFRGSNSATIAQFKEMKNLRQMLNKQASLPEAQRLFTPKEIDSLARVAEDMEADLINQSPLFRQALAPTTWDSVRQSLAPGEAAIEFISFRGTQDGETLTDSVLYCALVLRPDFDAPHLVWLFEEKQLVKILNQPGTLKNRVGSAYYDTDKLYQLLWKPLEPHIGPARRIWYAPDGLLHSVAFPAITRAGKRTLAHDLELFSLGSTRELIGRDSIPAPKMGTAALFGGARYDADSLCLRLRVGEVPPNLLAGANIPNDQKGDCRPAKFDFLQWSYREVVWLDSLLRSQGMTTQLHTNCAASKEAVLETGRNGENAPDILHISTHALYCDTTVDRAVRPGREPDFAANPLLRPHLALAGINHKLEGNPPYEGLEDGELFANDIKDLLLTNTDLVVLSACGTGLGSIRSGEGVFGMQRAFKLAGARHVLVSLWDVKDKETHDLMRAFYANWFGGMDIREAFLAAQRKMAQQGLHPYYWAGWVLI